MGFMSSNYRNTVMKDLPLVATNHYKPKKKITRDTSSIPMIFSPKMFPTASCVDSHTLLLETRNKTTWLGKIPQIRQSFKITKNSMMPWMTIWVV